ncbi:MAG: putative metalloprotease, partial [Thermomicrobiales bacterium]|nr:putative metalloprotease [Thermomicrobiales bacterium]
TVVKFRQHYHKIPIYGSLATVELDENNGLLAINTSTGEPIDVDPVATISPAQAIEVARQQAGEEAQFGNTQPRLFYYYDQATSQWRLVYIMEDVLSAPRDTSDQDQLTLLPEYFDYVVDAHSGELVAELPRTQTLLGVLVDAIDALSETRQIRVRDSQPRILLDENFNVRTHDFKFQDTLSSPQLLPGDAVANPPDPWPPAAVSAHANASEVAKFLKEALKRNGLDNAGGPIISTINCVRGGPPGTQEWRNAAWLPDRRQMVYGQRMVNGVLRSYAVAGDVVAHEILHGLTDATARLEYRFMSGALNESYSDIFGIIISNRAQTDIGQWNWELGEDLNVTGVPIRNLSDPGKHGQPAHMNDYQNLPITTDFGGVHINSGIHNKAAHNLLTTTDGQGAFMFTANEVAALFYLTLSQRLSRTSTFGESRSGVLSSAGTLFRNEPDRDARLAAIRQAFDVVGIT